MEEPFPSKREEPFPSKREIITLTREEEETRRLGVIRNVILEMFKSRNYSSKEEEVDPDKFRNNFNNDPIRARMETALIAFDQESKVEVMFCSVVKLTVSKLNEILHEMRKKEINHLILILQSQPTSSVRSVWASIAPQIQLEMFHESELTYNPLKHILSPKYIVLDEKEKEEVLDHYKVLENNIPKQSTTDAVSRFLGLKAGTMCRVIRRSDTAGLYESYRIVV